MEDVFTATYISQIAMSCQIDRGDHSGAGQKDWQGDDNDPGDGVIQHVFDRSDLRVAGGERNLSGEEVLERVKKLKSESPVQFRWMQ